ncbi:elongation factor P 5-aminopentanone reductase [Evansella tamaricis]|uniref:SDR family oxidoreductase n=1 Tax=Evansella tamaricis TaxID=2069301 RepID=A0ABS6JLE5_9BACI|nr:SDR family oxidoreductase [Evansella tamaricis]MBU9714490.1 SDR family oxidoreductase [Evansella tamaricis]
MTDKPLAFISGASGGIGGAISARLAEDGFDLVLHYNKNEDSITDLARSLEEKYETKIYIVQADFSKPEETVGKITNLSLFPDVIVHNSGSSKCSLITDYSQEDIKTELAAGIMTPFMLTQAFLPFLIRKKQGKIIILSSIWGLTGGSCEVLYSTVKGGLNSFVKALAKEVAPSNIQVNGVAPGAIKTPMLNHLSEPEQQQLAEEIPAGRLGSPMEVASVVSFLASKESNYVNGQIISVNGAWYC